MADEFLGRLLERSEHYHNLVSRVPYNPPGTNIAILRSVTPGTSRIHGFHMLDYPEQLAVIEALYGRPWLDFEARKMLEKGVRFMHNFKINECEHILPAKIEEFGVYRSTNGAKLMRRAGGIIADVDDSYPKALGQTLLIGVEEGAEERIQSAKPRIIDKANASHRHARAYDVSVRRYGNNVAVDIEVDPSEAMGAEIASKMAEDTADFLKTLTGARDFAGRVCSNSAGRLVKVRGEVSVNELGVVVNNAFVPGEKVAERIVALCEWAESDPSRAVTHNKGFMNGVYALAVPTGQDIRAIEAAVHHYSGRRPISRWRVEGDVLIGDAVLPIPCGSRGKSISQFYLSRILFEGDTSLYKLDADKLAETAASVGLASNLTALHMLATRGVTDAHRRDLLDG